MVSIHQWCLWFHYNGAICNKETYFDSLGGGGQFSISKKGSHVNEQGNLQANTYFLLEFKSPGNTEKKSKLTCEGNRSS